MHVGSTSSNRKIEREWIEGKLTNITVEKIEKWSVIINQRCDCCCEIGDVLNRKTTGDDRETRSVSLPLVHSKETVRRQRKGTRAQRTNDASTRSVRPKLEGFDSVAPEIVPRTPESEERSNVVVAAVGTVDPHGFSASTSLALASKYLRKKDVR